MASGGKSLRTRNFASVVYPESAPENWLDILTEQFVPAFISPLHDQDINPTGEPKKEHYHVLIMYDSVKTVEQATELFGKIGGVGCEIVQSIRGYARYLCHLDNPDKHQYLPSDVRALCGADYQDVIDLITEKYNAVAEIIEFCELHDVMSFSQLLKYCARNRRDWFKVLVDKATIVISEYVKSRSWSAAHPTAFRDLDDDL